MVTYLILRGGTYYFRFQIPERYQPVVGCRVIKRSLGTGRKREGKVKAAALARGVQGFLRVIELSEKNMIDVNSDEMKGKLHQYMEHLLEEDDLTRAIPRTQLPGFEGSVFTKNMIHTATLLYQDELERTLIHQDYEPVYPYLRRFMKEYNITVDEGSDDYYYLARVMCKMLLAVHEVYELRAAGDFRGELELKHLLNPGVITSRDHRTQSQVGIKLCDALDNYITAKKDSGDWNKSSPRHIVPTLEDFVQFIGPRIDVSELTRDKMREYKRKREKLPSRRHRSKYTGIDEGALLGMEIPQTHRLSSGALDNHYANVRGFINWLEEEDLIEKAKNLTSIISPKTIKPTGDEVAKRPFTDDELISLFQSELYYRGGLEKQKHHDRAWKFWAPVIALFTGARLEEIIQLYLDDIRLQDGIYYFSINNEDVKQVKTAPSIRNIPIHPFLIDIGLLRRVSFLTDKGVKYLFDRETLSKGEDSQLSSNVSKWFTRFRRKQGVGAAKDANSEVVFHSFRHSLVTLASHSNINRSMIKQTIGHLDGVNDDMLVTYEGEFAMSKVYNELILRIDYADRIDLGHLADNKWIDRF